MTSRALIRCVSGMVVAAALAGCGPGSGVYCQSGSKYGTQCYAEPDVQQPAGQPRPVQDGPRKGEPPANPPPNQVKW
jgi:hypothetical protein